MTVRMHACTAHMLHLVGGIVYRPVDLLTENCCCPMGETQVGGCRYHFFEHSGTFAHTAGAPAVQPAAAAALRTCWKPLSDVGRGSCFTPDALVVYALERRACRLAAAQAGWQQGMHRKAQPGSRESTAAARQAAQQQRHGPAPAADDRSVCAYCISSAESKAGDCLLFAATAHHGASQAHAAERLVEWQLARSLATAPRRQALPRIQLPRRQGAQRLAPVHAARGEGAPGCGWMGLRVRTGWRAAVEAGRQREAAAAEREPAVAVARRGARARLAKAARRTEASAGCGGGASCKQLQTAGRVCTGACRRAVGAPLIVRKRSLAGSERPEENPSWQK